MTNNKTFSTEDNDLETLYAELAQREAELVQRENALREKETALDVAILPTAAPTGLMEADLDRSTMPAEAQDGSHVHAEPEHRKAYGKWLRQSHPGCNPRKHFHVTLKKRNTEDRSFTLAAVDETDARRQAYQQASITQHTEGFHAVVQRVETT